MCDATFPLDVGTKDVCIYIYICIYRERERDRERFELRWTIGWATQMQNWLQDALCLYSRAHSEGLSQVIVVLFNGVGPRPNTNSSGLPGLGSAYLADVSRRRVSPQGRP